VVVELRTGKRGRDVSAGNDIAVGTSGVEDRVLLLQQVRGERTELFACGIRGNMTWMSFPA
jgi:hypothetical protein